MWFHGPATQDGSADQSCVCIHNLVRDMIARLPDSPTPSDLVDTIARHQAFSNCMSTTLTSSLETAWRDMTHTELDLRGFAHQEGSGYYKFTSRMFSSNHGGPCRHVRRPMGTNVVRSLQSLLPHPKTQQEVLREIRAMASSWTGACVYDLALNVQQVCSAMSAAYRPTLQSPLALHRTRIHSEARHLGHTFARAQRHDLGTVEPPSRCVRC